MNHFEIGVDIVKINRFDNKDYLKNENFLNKIFTKKELDYCFSKKNISSHLAGKFAAKEATIKALSVINEENWTYDQIEILNNSNGIPEVFILNNDLKIKISISHSEDNAIAMAIVYY